MQEIWQFVHRHLDRGVPVAMAVVTRHVGYPPGKRGFKMALTADGQRLGTVGGGWLEHDTLLKIGAILEHDQPLGELNRYDVPALPGSGRELPKAGEQWIATLALGENDRTTVRQIMQALDRKVEGLVTLTADGLRFQAGAVQKLSERFRETDDDWIYRERTGFPNRAFLIGGGHINWALSRVLATLNFQTLVFDPRMDLDTLRENRHAHQKIVVPYTQIGDYMIEGSKSYVVIATPDVTTDIQAMRQVLPLEWKYVGLMGNQEKLAYIADQMQREGFSREAFKKVTCPAGSAIMPRTVSEIAISIAAQIIQVKNRNE